VVVQVLGLELSVGDLVVEMLVVVQVLAEHS